MEIVHTTRTSISKLINDRRAQAYPGIVVARASLISFPRRQGMQKPHLTSYYYNGYSVNPERDQRPAGQAIWEWDETLTLGSPFFLSTKRKRHATPRHRTARQISSLARFSFFFFPLTKHKNQ